MAFKLIWSPTAKLDLKDIAAFIAEDSTSAAERFVRSLFHAVERLADFPESEISFVSHVGSSTG